MPTALSRLAVLLIVCTHLPAFAGTLQLTVPPHCFAVPGLPMSLYYDNLVLTEQPENYKFVVKSDLGTLEDRRWTVTPTDREVGDHVLEITVKDAQGQVMEQAKTTLHVVPRNAGADRTLKLLIIGDSLTHATVYPNEIARLLSEPGNPQWTMLGTHKPDSAKPGVAHEGYGGWTWSAFLTKFDPKPPGVTAGPLARKSTSPFIFANEQGKAVFDLVHYFRESCHGQKPDVVTFLLGINDCFGAKPDDLAAMDKHIDGVLANAEKLVAAFRQAAPQTVIALGLTTPPNARESGFEANYKGKYHRWGWKRIQHRLVQRMLERFGQRTQEQIFLVPTELNLDPIDGYPDNNGVHPNPLGYAQVGTSFYAWLKSWLAASTPRSASN